MKTRKVNRVYKLFERLRDEIKIPFNRDHPKTRFIARRDKSHFASKSAMLRHICKGEFE